jgi:FAD/FMN-containing dehydrogenase
MSSSATQPRSFLFAILYTRKVVMQIQKLKDLQLEGDILTDDETLIKFSTDASLFEVRPEIVIAPKTVEDIKKIVKFVAEEKKTDPTISITARSAGTDMSGGPLTTSIVLDFMKYFTHVKEVTKDFAITEPGVFYRDFEKETLQFGSILPSYPASRDLCAMGGIVSNNSGGEKTLTYGKTEDYIEQIKIVMEDGEEHTFTPITGAQLKEKIAKNDFEGRLYKELFDIIDGNYDMVKAAKPNVSKNSAGYYLWNVWDREKDSFDITKGICGSQGTFGMLTEMKLRLVPIQKHSEMVVAFMTDLSDLGNITNTMLEYKPESFESYDDKTLKLAIRFAPEMFKLMKATNIFKLGWSFWPEVLMTMRNGGLPKLVLMAEFTGNDPVEIHKKAVAAYEGMQKYKLNTRLVSEAESVKYWTIRRESFNLLRHHVSGKRTAPFIDDIIVRPEFMPEFLPKLNAILSEYPKLIYTIAGHVGNGNYHIIPLMDLHDSESRTIIPELSDRVYNLVLSYHGSTTAEHNDGMIRTPYLKQMYGDKITHLFELTKLAFDPLDIFNPNKKVHGDLKYAMDHLVKG